MLDEDSVSDLTPIANLKKLERLSIKKTRVQNLGPVSGIPNPLKFLYIADTSIADISPVQPLISGGMKLSPELNQDRRFSRRASRRGRERASSARPR